MDEERQRRLDQGVLARLRRAERLALLSELAETGLHERVWFDPEAWLAAADEPVAHEAVNELAHGGACVDRSELFRYARQALASRRGHEAVRLFTICQVWGAGSSGHRRARADTHKALAAPQLRAHLAHGIDQLLSGDAGRFYQDNRFSQLPGWGGASASRFAYAVATAHAQQGAGDPAFPDALILDGRTWWALTAALGWSSQQAAATTRWRRRYPAYVAAVHYWAAQLRHDEPRTTAHTVERLLADLGAAPHGSATGAHPGTTTALTAALTE